jgi:fructan beta-fructosidase
MKKLMCCLLASLCFCTIYAQQADTTKKPAAPKPRQEQTDPFRLDYKDVFDNMHYNQPLRPQVHYTPLTGQIADATGLVKYKGTYHLFYMSDEWSKSRRDNKNWGHAISNDCIYWTQEPPVTNSIIDNRPGSGSGIVDWNNSLGLQRGVEKTLVIFYTDYGRGMALEFSNDAGKTWIRHKANPIIPMHGDMRDPNVFWYKPDQSWRMVLYERNGFQFYKSTDLVHWEFLSRMDGFYECPDIMQMPVDGNENNKKWVLINGNGAYYIGNFDGNKFIPETPMIPIGPEIFMDGGHRYKYTKDIYATQTWKQSYEGDGPFYQLGFMLINSAPNQPRTWSQQLFFPVELSLRTIDKQIKLCRNPIDGIKQLRYDPHVWDNTTLKPGVNLLDKIQGDVFETIANISLGSAKQITFNIRGVNAVYNVKDKELQFLDTKVKVDAPGNKLSLRFIIDRNSVEIYGNQGEANVTRFFYPDQGNRNLGVEVTGGESTINKLEVYRLESIWLKREQELGNQRENQPMK